MPSSRYNQTDEYLHILSQVTAKANRTFVKEKEDDSHTNLYFDSVSNRLLGRWFHHDGQRYLLAFNLYNRHFELIDDAQKAHAKISMETKTVGEIESEIEAALNDLGLDASGYRDSMHYEIPDYNSIGHTDFTLTDDAIEEWCRIRAMANNACHRLLGHVQTSSEVRIWPHHFDTGIYAEVNHDLGLGFGLAMKDDQLNAPYFYMTGYPQNGEIQYKDLPDLGPAKWIVKENWKGAVLAIDEIQGSNPKKAIDMIDAYMASAYDWFIAASRTNP